MKTVVSLTDWFCPEVAYRGVHALALTTLWESGDFLWLVYRLQSSEEENLLFLALQTIDKRVWNVYAIAMQKKS